MNHAISRTLARRLHRRPATQPVKTHSLLGDHLRQPTLVGALAQDWCQGLPPGTVFPFPGLKKLAIKEFLPDQKGLFSGSENKRKRDLTAFIVWNEKLQF
jgi:hypothetical protein